MLGGMALPARAEREQADAPCTITQGCVLPSGHEGSCQVASPSAPDTGGSSESPEQPEEDQQPAPCTKTDGCTLPDGHDGSCNVPCPTPGCILQAGHEGECTTSCKEGCILEPGHEGECFVPCTKTEGCTLVADHEGECVLMEQAVTENEEPAFYLWFMDGDREIKLTEVTGPINAQIRFNGAPLAAEAVVFYGVSYELIEDDFYYRILPEQGGTITYEAEDGSAYTIIVNAASQTGPEFYYEAGEMRGNLLQLNVGDSIRCQLYYRNVQLTELSDITYDASRLEITAENSAFTIKALASGNWTIVHEGTAIRVQVSEETISNVGVPDGLYFFFGRDSSEEPVFFSDVSFTNSFSGPLYLVVNGTAQMIKSYENLTITPATGVKTEFHGRNFYMQRERAGHYTITYTDPDTGKTYSAMANVEEQRAMYARINGEGNLLDQLTVDEGAPMTLKFYYISESGAEVPIRGHVFGNDDTIQIAYDPQTQLYTLTATGTGDRKFAVYTSDDTTTFLLPIIRQKAQRLAVDAGNGMQYDLVLDAGQTLPVTFFFGTEGNMLPYTESITCLEGLELKQEDGKTVLSATEPGTFNLSTVKEGKTYTVTVTVVPALSGGSLFALSNGSGTPQFSTAILFGEQRSLRLCYGSYGQYETLTMEKLTVSGSSVTVAEDKQGNLILTGAQSGQTLLQYTDGDQITHNYIIKCYANSDESLFARYSPYASDATVMLPYDGTDLSVGFAWHTADTMYMFPGTSVYLSKKEDKGIDDALCLGAMKATGDYTVDGLADPGFYSTVSNVMLSIFSGTDSQNFQLGQRESQSWQGVTLSQFSTHAAKGANFSVLLLMTFDVQMDGKTCRFYRTAPFSYKTEPDDDVTVSIEDADILNTILSNRDVLINYLEDNVEGYHYSGGSITLNLPAVSYNKIIVSQILLTGSEDYLATLTLKGAPGTTMPGLFSKGFLSFVDGISFVSNGQTMPDGRSCGIMVDNRPTTFQPEFD